MSTGIQLEPWRGTSEWAAFKLLLELGMREGNTLAPGLITELQNSVPGKGTNCLSIDDLCHRW